MKWKRHASLKVWQRCTSWHCTRTVNFPLFILWPTNGVTCLLDFRIFNDIKMYCEEGEVTTIVTRQWSIEVGIIVQDWGSSQRCCCEIVTKHRQIFSILYGTSHSFGSTKPSATTSKWGRSQSLIRRKPSHFYAAVCPRTFRWMLATMDIQMGNKCASLYEALLSETVYGGSNSPTLKKTPTVE